MPAETAKLTPFKAFHDAWFREQPEDHKRELRGYVYERNERAMAAAYAAGVESTKPAARHLCAVAGALVNLFRAMEKLHGRDYPNAATYFNMAALQRGFSSDERLKRYVADFDAAISAACHASLEDRAADEANAVRDAWYAMSSIVNHISCDNIALRPD